MQQLERGCADIPSLARFLGATVKQHCAPMRDDLVDAMVEACEGRGLAKGLEMCFEILELMKLVRPSSRSSLAKSSRRPSGPY